MKQDSQWFFKILFLFFFVYQVDIVRFVSLLNIYEINKKNYESTFV